MKKTFILITVAFLGMTVWPAFAADIVPIPISAEDAFYSVQSQTDPLSGEDANVALIDVRSRAEYFWVGAASKVDEILTIGGESIIPDLGRVILAKDGKNLLYSLHGRSKKLQVKKVESMRLSPISINIPFKIWDESSAKLTLNPNFVNDLMELKGGKYGNFDTLIFFCRSGGRSQDCLVNLPEEVKLFSAYYEIDQPDGKSGRGGFEGTSYGNVYNGYRGFPDRTTRTQGHPSVSWKDTGLPIKTSLSPFVLE